MTLSIARQLKQRFFNSLLQAQVPLKEKLERAIMLDAKLLEVTNQSRSILPSLNEVEFCVFSQWGEDGIIAWLIYLLEDIPRTFVEFGVENYQESNTRYLLQSRNWRGLIIDGSPKNIADIHRQDFHWRYDLTAACAFIDCDNINNLLEQYGFVGEIGLLSIDIDGNDYWVWEKINVARPILVVCEYNAVFGDLHSLTVPYKQDFERSRAHDSCLYFGASISALVRLAEKKGYALIGTTSTGCNAFFVRDDHASRIMSKLDRISIFPSSIREARDKNGALQFTSGINRAKLISNQSILDLETGVTDSLSGFGELYSDLWMQGKPRTLPKKQC